MRQSVDGCLAVSMIRQHIEEYVECNESHERFGGSTMKPLLDSSSHSWCSFAVDCYQEVEISQ